MLSPYDPSTWSWVDWALVAWGAWFFVNFVVHYARFERLERAALAGDQEALHAFNRAIKGFPHSGFAKMLGKTSLAKSGLDAGRR